MFYGLGYSRLLRGAVFLCLLLAYVTTITYLCGTTNQIMRFYCHPKDALEMHKVINCLDQAGANLSPSTLRQEPSYTHAKYLVLEYTDGPGDGFVQQTYDIEDATRLTVEEFLGFFIPKFEANPPKASFSVTYPIEGGTITVQSTDAKLFRAACADLNSRTSAIVEALRSLPDPDLAKE